MYRYKLIDFSRNLGGLITAGQFLGGGSFWEYEPNLGLIGQYDSLEGSKFGTGAFLSEFQFFKSQWSIDESQSRNQNYKPLYLCPVSSYINSDESRCVRDVFIKPELFVLKSEKTGPYVLTANISQIERQ